METFWLYIALLIAFLLIVIISLLIQKNKRRLGHYKPNLNIEIKVYGHPPK